MSRYFFHVDDGVSSPDFEGIELSGLAAAREQAIQATGEILKDLDGKFWATPASWIMNVTDDQNHLQFTLRLSADLPSAEVIFFPRPPPL